MVYNREEAARRAEASKTNTPGTCQAWTRTQFGAPSVGDVDRDGDADAVDGWKSEPVSKLHTDRNPPRGVPVAWSGGRNGYGHRAISLGNGKIRSTDAGGLGKVATVDLEWVEKTWGMHYLGWSETISGILIPEAPTPTKPPKQKKTKTLRMAWISLQFSDTDAQHTADITKIFSRKYHVIFGSESGPGAGNTTEELHRIGEKMGYYVQAVPRYDSWVAVRKSLVRGRPKVGTEFVLWRSSKYEPTPPGRWGDKGIVWLSFNMKKVFGIVTVGAVHYLNHKGPGEALKKQTDLEYAAKIGIWGKKHGKKSKIAFIGGDFNLRDDKNDVFLSLADFKTCWDDLKKWPNTGHGNIDAIARYKPDRRVKCVSARVLNDKKLFLNTDHFLVEAEYEITAL